MYGIVMLDKSLVMWQKTGSNGIIPKIQSTCRKQDRAYPKTNFIVTSKRAVY